MIIINGFLMLLYLEVELKKLFDAASAYLSPGSR